MFQPQKRLLQNGGRHFVKTVLKELGFFLSKCSNVVHFELNDLIQISAACSPKTYTIMYLETFDKYLKHHMLVKFEQNRLIRNIQNFELFWEKMVNHF